MITIVDYGMGNLGSIVNMFKRIGCETQVTSEPGKLQDAGKILLPGVGSFDKAIQRINDSGLREVLDERVLQDKIPVLGICLGMQLLTNGSEEGVLPGLGWIKASCKKFPVTTGLKVPHMGWNIVRPSNESPLIRELPEESRYYFVHSYYVSVEDGRDSMLTTTYGIQFDSAIQHGNIFGAQFHPEKSHKFGMQFLQGFAGLEC